MTFPASAGQKIAATVVAAIFCVIAGAVAFNVFGK